MKKYFILLSKIEAMRNTELKKHFNLERYSNYIEQWLIICSNIEKTTDWEKRCIENIQVEQCL
jgi:hypothetical protein